MYSQHRHCQNGEATVTSALVIRKGSMRGDSSSRPFWLCRFNSQGLAVRGWCAEVTVNEGNERSGRQNAMACVSRKGTTINVGCQPLAFCVMWRTGSAEARLPAAVRHTRLWHGDTWLLPRDNGTQPLPCARRCLLPRSAQGHQGRPQSGLVPSLHCNSNADLCSLQHQENISHHFYVLCFCAPCTRLRCSSSSKEQGRRLLEQERVYVVTMQ